MTARSSRLGPATAALVERLHDFAGDEPRSWWSRWRRRRVLAALGASQDIGAAIALVPSLAEDPRTARTAARALARLLGEPRDGDGRWTALARSRPESRRAPPSNWSRLQPKDIDGLARLPHAWAALAMASLHPNGRVREAAVAALAGREDADGRELPYLLLRVHDSAAEVRAAAEAAIAARLTPARAPAWVDALPVLAALQRRRGRDHAPLIAAAEALLRSPEARPALRAGALSRDPAVRREVQRLAAAGERADPTIGRSGLHDADLAVRLHAYRNLLRLPAGRDRTNVLLGGLADATPVRELVLASMLAHGDDCAPERLEASMLDRRSPAIRRSARDLLARGPQPRDPAALYRRLVAAGDSSPRLRGAILGLGETGDPDDIAALEPHLAHPHAHVRKAARQAIAALRRAQP